MARARFSRNEVRVLVLTGTAHFTTHFYEVMFPTLAVALARESGLPLAQVLGWSFAGYLLFGIGALPAGLVADRVGHRPLLIAGMLGMGSAALAAGRVAPGPSLALLLAVIGACASIYHPAGMGLISHTVRARGRALGINGIFGNLGIALTPIVVAALAARIGWQRTYLLAGGATCAAAILCALVPIDERPVAPAHAMPARGGGGRAPCCSRSCAWRRRWPASATGRTRWRSRPTSPSG
jgi:MFS family permease